MTAPVHDDPTDRDWVSFDDENGDSWLFDATMLTSNWRCIWNDGCPGIESGVDPALMYGCCSHGAHFSGDEDLARVRSRAARLSVAQWANHDRFDNPITTDDDGESVTHRHDGVCVFHNPPGFDGGTGCALHIGAREAGESPVDWKPDVCWQLPLRLEHHEDDNGHNTYFVREWNRGHWGEGGVDLGYWCTESPDAFIAHEPAFVSLESELRALTGDGVYEHLCERLNMTAAVLLPHPASRAI